MKNEKPKERPILFSTPMVRAIAEGRKVQTRRIIKFDDFCRSQTPGYDWSYRNKRGLWHDLTNDQMLKKCPQGVLGDLLWVRETWQSTFVYSYNIPPIMVYRADVKAEKYFQENCISWKPSIFMPKEIARYWLRLKKVRIEPLQSITPIGIKYEGVGSNCNCNACTQFPYELQPHLLNAWIELWDSLNKKRGFGWDANPWVWVETFELTEAPNHADG